MTHYYNGEMKQVDHYPLIAEMLHWLTEHQVDQPGLAALSQQFGISEYHLQRTFQAFAGVTPKQFLKFLTKEQALARLKRGEDVLQASLECGLSSPSRLHDLLVTTEAVTPGQARRKGAGLEIARGLGITPFGEALIAWTARGICFLAFCHTKTALEAADELKRQWPAANYRVDNDAAIQWLRRIFEVSGDQPLRLWLHGSPFQLQVWQALLRIPAGVHCSYGQLASLLGRPSAARAVGRAVGSNPVSWLIPCHRVISSLATPGGYRWGIPTKMAMVGYEAARARS